MKTKVCEIRGALSRLSCIEQMPCCYDPTSEIFGEGPIHYLVEVDDQYFIAWGNDETKTIIVNPIKRFSLDELEELSAEERMDSFAYSIWTGTKHSVSRNP